MNAKKLKKYIKLIDKAVSREKLIFWEDWSRSHWLVPGWTAKEPRADDRRDYDTLLDLIKGEGRRLDMDKEENNEKR